MSNLTNEAALTAAKIESKESSTENSAFIVEAIDQIRSATSAICQVFSSVGSVSTDLAKLKILEGKAKAQEIGRNTQTTISEKPLTSVGGALAAGWLVSRLIKP